MGLLDRIQDYIDNQGPRKYGALDGPNPYEGSLLRSGRKEAPASVQAAQAGQYF